MYSVGGVPEYSRGRLRSWMWMSIQLALFGLLQLRTEPPPVVVNRRSLASGISVALAIDGVCTCSTGFYAATLIAWMSQEPKRPAPAAGP